MKMKLFQTLTLKFEKTDWAKNPEFRLMDTLLDMHPGLMQLVAQDILQGCKQSDFGRQDIPSVEQIFRAAIYRELKQLDYRDYTTSAKRFFFKINNTKSGDKRTDLFREQLITFTKCINLIPGLYILLLDFL